MTVFVKMFYKTSVNSVNSVICRSCEKSVNSVNSEKGVNDSQRFTFMQILFLFCKSLKNNLIQNAIHTFTLFTFMYRAIRTHIRAHMTL